jgi:hypothetical protein
MSTTKTRSTWRLDTTSANYYRDEEIKRSTVEKEVTDVLGKATLGKPWADPQDVQHIPILLHDEVVGNLWEKHESSLHNLKIGGYWAARFGTRVELVKNYRVVGMLWLEPKD